VKERSGLSADLNKGFGGNFTYLRVVWTSDASEAAKGFIVTCTPRASSEMLGGAVDFVDGRKGGFRYVVRFDPPNEERRVVGVHLVRSTEARVSLSQNQVSSNDLNHGRGGDFLYIVCDME
jgi:hypothetical protein